ncbi:hypothetical protein BGX38DRAFT_462758 [Terfezia claveryi]|nr:hypothetical protein BGX38DRAFT_462758 [Terfezia claveryi]
MPSLKSLFEKPVVSIYQKCLDTLRRHLSTHSSKLKAGSDRPKNLPADATNHESAVPMAQVADEDLEELDDMISDFSPSTQRSSIRMNHSSTTSISELNRRSSIRLVVAEEEPENTSSSGGVKPALPKDSVNGRSIRGNWVVHTWGRRDAA